MGDPLDLRHDALVVLVALRVAVGAGVLLNNLLDVLAELHTRFRLRHFLWYAF